jgi:hypothetical protein
VGTGHDTVRVHRPVFDARSLPEATVKDDKPGNGEDFRHINFFRALLFRIWGPSDQGPNGPLAGTKYDPLLKKARERQRREERRERP